MRDDKATYTHLLEIMLELMRGDDRLEEPQNLEEQEHPIGGKYIKFRGNGFRRICVYEYEKAPQNTFSLVIFAGDTAAQAKELFTHFSNAKVVELEKSGWILKSHFHFAWQRKNILSTCGDKALALSEYIDYWKQALHDGYIRKYNKNEKEFDLLKEMMSNARMMDENDIARFDEYFSANNYKSVITCPGIVSRISYSKERLNGDHRILSAELKEKFMSLAEIYDQNYVPTPKS